MSFHLIHRLVGNHLRNGASLRVTRETFSSPWIPLMAIVGGTASAILVVTDSSGTSDDAGHNISKDDGIDKCDPVSYDCSPNIPTPFVATTPRVMFPMQVSMIRAKAEAEQERYTLFGRRISLKRNKTISLYKSEVSKETVRSRYKVAWNRPLGQGGFGAVYSATDRKTGEKVALKQISKKYTNDVGFQREMEALLHLRRAGGHPNICGLRENFDEGNYFYFSLDLILGGEMFDHLISSGPYSEEDASRLVREVASALDFMHGIGIVHG